MPGQEGAWLCVWVNQFDRSIGMGMGCVVGLIRLVDWEGPIGRSVGRSGHTGHTDTPDPIPQSMKSGHGRGARGRRPLRLRGGLDGPGLRRLHGGHGGAYSVPINATASCLTGTLFLEDTYQRLNPSHNPRQCGAVAKGSTCSQSSFAPTKAADGWCEIKSKEVLDLLHGSAFVQMKFEQEEEGSDFSFHFIKKVCNFCCICCWGGAEGAIAGYVLRLRRASGIHRLTQYHRTPRNDNDNSTTTRAFTCPSSAARATRPPSRYAHIHPSIHPSKHPPPLPTQLTNLPYIQKR